MDQDKMIKIYARSDSRIQLKMIPGTFRNFSVSYHALSGPHHHEIQSC